MQVTLKLSRIATTELATFEDQGVLVMWEVTQCKRLHR